MELNKLSISVISVLVTLAISFGGFMYRQGVTNAKICNLKENQIMLRADYKKDIELLTKTKAEKEIVQMIFTQINNINNKIDKLIESKEDKEK